MPRETIHKRLEPGTLVQLSRTQEYGIVVRVKINWDVFGDGKTNSPFSYSVLVKGEEVSESEGGLTIIGDN